MAHLSTEELQRLKKAFTENPKHVDVTYATANRYYDLWGNEIKRALESRLLPSLEESVKRHANKRRRLKIQPLWQNS